MRKNQVTPLYMFFAITFVAAILIANIIAIKQIKIGIIGSAPAGVLVFPLTYIMSDVVAEVYGFKAMRRIIWIGFLFTALQSLLLVISAVLPAPIWFAGSKSFDMIAIQSPRMLLGQVVAYLLGEWANATVISKMKFMHWDKTGSKKMFSIRAVASTVIGEGIDSAIFIPIAFIGINPLNTIISTVIIQASLKIGYEILMLPVTNIIVSKTKQYEGIDIVDKGIKYSLIK